VLEHLIVLLSFIGIVSALAQVAAESRQDQIDRAAWAADEGLRQIARSTEWAMYRCEVWWDAVLNQANDRPAACQKKRGIPLAISAAMPRVRRSARYA
jgi:hypothetical protein